MSKKITGIAICALLFTLSIPAEAQQPTKKVPVIGVLLADTALAYASYVEAFQQGLRDLAMSWAKTFFLSTDTRTENRNGLQSLQTS